ncbi:NUDIX hydrolase [Candidatus Thioglobus sp.]|nr:NUDIX hydrolase [Candidatus Thioglobus sp.]
MRQHKIQNTITSETTSLPESIEYHGCVYEDKFKRIERITAKFDGFKKEYFVSDFGQKSAVLVISDKNVLLVRQYRLLINRISFEVPGGKVDEGETPESSAKRECMEETGVLIHNLKPLIEYDPDLEYTKNHTYVFYSEKSETKNFTKKTNCEWVSLRKCLKMIKSGIITDSLSIIAIMTYKLNHGA